jgi:hypothetical protein
MLQKCAGGCFTILVARSVSLFGLLNTENTPRFCYYTGTHLISVCLSLSLSTFLMALT